MTKEEQLVDLGKYINNIRTSKGMSAYSIWKNHGIDQGTWSKIESGKKGSGLSPDTLQQISKILEIDVTELYLIAGYLTQENIEYIKANK